MSKEKTHDNCSLLSFLNLKGDKFKPLSLEEEETLFDEIKKGNKEALDRVVNANMRFVASKAIEFAKSSIIKMPIDDLFQDGCQALCAAAKRYDNKKGCKFITYAGKAIISKMIANLQNNWKYSETFSSYDDTLEDESTTKREKVVADYDICCVDRKTQITTIEEVISERLDERERYIITNQFGILEGDDNVQVQEIAENLSITPERVRQIKNSALAKLRKDDRLYYLYAA